MKLSKVEGTTMIEKRAGQRGKSIEEVVEYAVSHRTRSQILTILDQGIYTTAELSEITGEPLNRIGNHIRELLDAGSIEIAGTRRRRNTQQHFYRTVRMPFFSESEAEAMTWQERQVRAGLIVQGLVAELMAALWAGEMFDEPRDWVTWEHLDLDPEGRQELFEEQRESWERLQAIKARAAARVAETGATTSPQVVAVLGFKRALSAPEPSYSKDPD